jgi:hypothetical protein
MRIEMGKWRSAKGEVDPKRRLLRAETTRAETTHTLSGKRKTHGGPKPVTLPKLSCQTNKEE